MATLGPFQSALRSHFKLQLEVHVQAAQNRFRHPTSPIETQYMSPQTELLLKFYIWLGGTAIVCLGDAPKYSDDGVVNIADAENADRIAHLHIKKTGQTGIFPNYAALCFGDPDGEHRWFEHGPQADNTVGDPATEPGLGKKSHRGNPTLPVYFAFESVDGRYRICDWILMGTWEIVPSEAAPATAPLPQQVAAPVIGPKPASGITDDEDLIDLGGW